MIEASELVVFIIGLISSAFFSGSEAALLSISPDRLDQLIEEGGKKGNALSFLYKKPNEVLTTILIGNNIVNVLTASLTTSIAQRTFKSDVIAISVFIATMLILIFGEIIPKTFARTHAEKLSFVILKILRVFYFLLWFVVTPFNWIVNQVLGENATLRGRIVTKKDIEFMVSKAEEDKSIDSKQLDLLTSILEFPKIKVKEIMVPRNKVKTVGFNSTYSEIIEYIKEDNHSRYPVIDGDLDKTIGFLHVKDLAFVQNRNDDQFNIEQFLKPPFFVYEHMRIQSVFEHMNRKKVHLALIKDENGVIVGIITLEDIVEEIVGEIHDEHDDENDMIDKGVEQSLEEAEGITVESTINLRDLYTEYDLKIPSSDNYSTLNGFILEMMGNRFPQEGKMLVWGGYTFELVRVENHEIKDVKINQNNTSTPNNKNDSPLSP
jgi:putative hemolysin